MQIPTFISVPSDSDLDNINSAYVIDPVSNTIIDDSRNTQALYCLDGILTPTNYQKLLNAKITKPIIQDVTIGFNSSLLLVNSKSCVVDDILFGQDDEGLVETMAAGLIDTPHKSISFQAVEIYSESIRDLLTPSFVVKIHQDSVESSHASITSSVDFQTMIKKIQSNQLRSMDNSQTCTIYSFNLEQPDFASTLSIVCLPTIDYYCTDRNKVILNHGPLIAKSTTIVYETILSDNRDLAFDKATISRVLANHIGGNCRTRLFCSTTIQDFNDDYVKMICNLCKSIKKIQNYPIFNSHEYISLRKRELVIAKLTRIHPNAF